MKYFVLITVALVGTCFAGELRRDEKWPPKMLLEFLEPIRKVCLAKTGVTVGNNVNETAIIICLIIISSILRRGNNGI